MKRSIKLALMIMATLLFAFFAVACNSADTISVSEEGEFQTVYILGQELDLSGGILIVGAGDSTTEIPLDSSDITVSGYDKDTLGKQTVKIEYGNASTEISVTVVERVQIIGVPVDYLVGAELDRSRGVVKVTSLKGVTSTFKFSDDEISVSGFDSSVAGMNKTVNVTCTDGEESCGGAFEVNIYAVDTVDFRKPNKVTYGSHYEGKVDPAGGRLVFKGKGGELKREVVLSADMISGFDVSQVNEENSPYTQRLTVSYDGKTYTYDVQLIYTDVSEFNDNAEKFEAVNWEGDTLPSIDKSLGELAMSLMSAYIDMEQMEQDLIDEALSFNVARTAMVYGFNLWANDIKRFEGVFAIENGYDVLYLESYDKVKASLAYFDDEDSPMYTVSPLLLELIDIYGDEVIYENETMRLRFSSYPVKDDYELMQLQMLLEHSLEIYDLTKDIPAGCSGEALEAHYDNLTQTVVAMIGQRYVYEYPDLYYFVSAWREEDDLFDLLYTYLYETEQKSFMEAFIVYGLPTNVRQVYAHILTASLSMEELQSKNPPYFDTTRLLFNYYRAEDFSKIILADEGTAENYLYLNAPVNILFGMDASVKVSFEDMIAYVRSGIFDLADGLLEVECYGAIMKDYVTFLNNCIEISGFEETAEYGNGVKGLFDKFVALSPSQQYNFISILNLMYKLGYPNLSFDESDEYAYYASFFNLAINDFMKSKFSEGKADVYVDLILAIEIYANRFNYPEWEEDFTARMEKVAGAKEQLTGEDKANFEYYLLGAYNKYVSLMEGINKTTDLGQWEECFEELKGALLNVQTAYYTSSNYNYFLASFEKALAISNNIIKNAPPSICSAYYNEPLFKAYTDGDGEDVYWSCEFALDTYRSTYIDILIRFGSSNIYIYDTYFERGVDKFLVIYYDMIDAFMNKVEGDTSVFDKDKTIGVLNAFAALDSKTKAFFITLEGGESLYSEALSAFISEAFTENAAAVAAKLFELETGLYTYEVSGSDVTLESISGLLSQLTAMYEQLSDEDEASFSPLKSIYDAYVAKCGELLA